MPRSKDQALHNQRQQQILEAARKVFAEKGFANSRMEDVALEADLSKGSLYMYFKNKDDLIGGLLLATFDDSLAALRLLIVEDGHPKDILIKHMQQWADYLQQDASTISIAYGFYSVAAYQNHIRDFLRGYFAEYRNILGELFKQGIERGDFAPFDTSIAAILLIAQLEGVVLLWFTDPDTIQLDYLLTRCVETFFDNLKTQ